jgi:hypothetical protein
VPTSVTISAAVSPADSPSAFHLLAKPFMHSTTAFMAMAQLLQRGRAPAELIGMTAADDTKLEPYSTCPCDSGAKFSLLPRQP